MPGEPDLQQLRDATGLWHSKRSKQIAIAQAKPQQKERIRRLLRRLGFTFSEHEYANSLGYGGPRALPLTRFIVPNGIRGSVKGKGWARLGDYLDKRLSPAMIGMSRRQFEIFWEELPLGDGNGDTMPNRRQQLYVSDALLLGRLQATAIRAGFATNATPVRHSANVWLMSISVRPYVEIHPHSQQGTVLASLEQTPEPVRVWCGVSEPLIERPTFSHQVCGLWWAWLVGGRSELRGVVRAGFRRRPCRRATASRRPPPTPEAGGRGRRAAGAGRQVIGVVSDSP
jgi:hypothetical protein